MVTIDQVASDEPMACAAVKTQVVHRVAPCPAPLQEATTAGHTRTPRCASHVVTRVRAHGPGPDLPRDRSVLIRLARHRVLSLAQLQQLVFPGIHRSCMSRRVTALEHLGWVSTWEQPVEWGGRPRFVLPTVKGLRWALARIEEETAAYTYARLVATMLRRDDRQPLPLVRRIMPPFLAHLCEVNDALIALQTDHTLQVLWSSSWNRPFPDVWRGVTLPQPDGVVALAAPDGSTELVFLEHDRGGERLRHFSSHKVDTYRRLAQRPGLADELFGVRRFRVLVTVSAGGSALNARRIAKLRRCATARLVGGLFTIVPVETVAQPV